VTAPQRTRIKFCGMTRAEDAAGAASLGVDAIGLIFAARSPRRVDLAAARALRAALPPFVSVVALVMDNEPSEIRQIVQILRPDLLQFHGAEDPADCAAYGLPWLKAVPMAQPEAARAYATRYAAASAFVLDSHAVGEAGGSGKRFAWDAIPELPRPILLAGGLTPHNVFDAVRTVRPWAVDVSSGIEAAPGQKDVEKMRRFVAQVRAADAMDQANQDGSAHD
jgi:phosphoribosylanthranilate isomerase